MNLFIDFWRFLSGFLQISPTILVMAIPIGFSTILCTILFFSLFIPPTKFYLMLYSKRKTPLQHNGVIPILVGYLIFNSGKKVVNQNLDHSLS